MDIDQLRGWAAFMDRAMIVSLIAAIMAVMALGTTTWLSFKFGGAVRAHEHSMRRSIQGDGEPFRRASRMSSRTDRVWR